MALLVEGWVVVVLDAVLGVRRDAGRDAAIGQRLAEGGRAVGPVSEQEASWGQLIEDRGGGLVVVGLSLGEVKEQRPPLVVADHLQLGGQTPSAAADTPG